jgi:hypothetical protein
MVCLRYAEQQFNHNPFVRKSILAPIKLQRPEKIKCFTDVKVNSHKLWENDSGSVIVYLYKIRIKRVNSIKK